MSNNTTVSSVSEETFFSPNFTITNWESLKPYSDDLLERTILSFDEFEKWIQDWNAFFVKIEETLHWSYIKTCVDTNDAVAKERFMQLQQEVVPPISLMGNEMDKKFINSPFLNQLDPKLFFTTIRKIKAGLELHRDENIPLFTELNVLQNNYQEITGSQTIEHEGKTLTLVQATALLENPDRALRETVYRKINERKIQDADALDNLLSELIQIRHKIALNAGFENYRDYKFKELNRFDYSADDCFKFHEAMEHLIMPIVNKQAEKRRQELGYEKLYPWDLDVDTTGKPGLKPTSDINDLIEKSISVLGKTDPFFATCLTKMKEIKHLDLDNRAGKAGGGYNMDLPETRVPFIFMNATGTLDDAVTILHEAGHAVHSFLTNALTYNFFKGVSSEMAEVASMSMELMTMNYWSEYFSDSDDLNRAKKEHLKTALTRLPKVAQGDAFQHWMYEFPNHTIAERRAKWLELDLKFSPNAVERDGFEHNIEIAYHRILHFFIVPFYYIEYAFAQLGAVGVWKNYQDDSAKTIAQYKSALVEGGTVTIPEFYKLAGVEFDFSKEKVRDIAAFLEAELEKLS